MIWYILIIIIVIIIIYFIIEFLKDTFTNTNDIKLNISSYLSEMIKLQNKQVALTSNMYNNLSTPELKNVADFIMQNIPPTTKILEEALKKLISNKYY